MQNTVHSYHLVIIVLFSIQTTVNLLLPTMYKVCQIQFYGLGKETPMKNKPELIIELLNYHLENEIFRHSEVVLRGKNHFCRNRFHLLLKNINFTEQALKATK